MEIFLRFYVGAYFKNGARFIGHTECQSLTHMKDPVLYLEHVEGIRHPVPGGGRRVQREAQDLEIPDEPHAKEESRAKIL